MKKSIQILLVSIMVLFCSFSTLAKPKAHLTGMASYYGSFHHGRLTANGERFNKHALTAAHKKLPFNTKIKVTNLANNKSIIVRINDRGPYKKGRILDLSEGAAKRLGMMKSGVSKVKIEIL